MKSIFGFALGMAIVILLSAVIYGVTVADPEVPMMGFSWDASTTGTPAHHYSGVVESWPTTGGDTIRIFWETPDDTPNMLFTYAFGYAIRCRVAGVDSLDRQSDYSIWSEIHVDHGPPGQPGQPRFGLVMKSFKE